MTQEITAIQQEVDQHLKDPATLKTLVATTFKGLHESVVKQAIVEGMIRGFTFKNFLERDVYAIPFREGYSLVTSVDYARKKGMRSGVVGKSAPTFDEHDGKIVTCTVTIKRKVSDEIGDFTATVFFSEYFKQGKNGYPSLWETKPHTMIAKVAEMHALRMACPEELAQSYVEEEMEREQKEKPESDLTAAKEKLDNSKTLEELKTVWAELPADAKAALLDYKNELKNKYESPKVQ